MIADKHNHKQNYFGGGGGGGGGGGNIKEIAGKASGLNKHRNPPILSDFNSMYRYGVCRSFFTFHTHGIWINITGWVGEEGHPFLG